jgi:hypothetical protein
MFSFPISATRPHEILEHMFEKRVALSLKSARRGMGNEEKLIAIGNV